MAKTQDNIDYSKDISIPVQTNIKLTLAFAQAVAKHQVDKSDNLVVSAHNAAAALSMVALGADGETRDEMAQALFGVDGALLDSKAAEYANLDAKIKENNKGQVDVTTANGVWANKNNVELRDSFVKNVKEVFGADVSAEDYADPATVKKINDWAAKNTNNLIPEIIGGLSPDDAVVLASALHFKGQWTDEFDKKLTKEKSFMQDGGVEATTPTMHQDFRDEISFDYLEDSDYQAISMTYGKIDYDAEKYPTMRIVLVRPSNEKVSARDFLAAQSSKTIPAWLVPAAYRGAAGFVEMPRLDISQKHDIIPALKDMGIKKAFDGADFTKMTEKDGDKLLISKVSHDVVFKTDEKGSEGAAVTTVGIIAFSVPRWIEMKLDRSFIFAVQDIKSGAVLFLGTVNKPNKDTKPVSAAKLKM